MFSIRIAVSFFTLFIELCILSGCHHAKEEKCINIPYSDGVNWDLRKNGYDYTIELQFSLPENFTINNRNLVDLSDYEFWLFEFPHKEMQSTTDSSSLKIELFLREVIDTTTRPNYPISHQKNIEIFNPIINNIDDELRCNFNFRDTVVFPTFLFTCKITGLHIDQSTLDWFVSNIHIANHKIDTSLVDSFDILLQRKEVEEITLDSIYKCIRVRYCKNDIFDDYLIDARLGVIEYDSLSHVDYKKITKNYKGELPNKIFFCQQIHTEDSSLVVLRPVGRRVLKRGSNSDEYMYEQEFLYPAYDILTH